MGLSLAIGMLIDDAIVVRENIVRHVQMGKDHVTAARDGTAEIGLAVHGDHASPSSPCSSRSRSWAAWSASSSTSSASRWPPPCWCRCSSASPSTRCCRRAGYDPDVEARPAATFRHRAAAAALQRLVRPPARALRAASSAGRCAIAATVMAIAASASSSAASRSWAMLGGDFMPDFNRGEYQISLQGTPGQHARARPGDRAREVMRRAARAARTSTTPTRPSASRHAVPAGHRGHHYVKLKPQRAASTFSEVLREARSEARAGARLHLRPRRGRRRSARSRSRSACAARRSTSSIASRAELMEQMRKIHGVADIETSLEKTKPELRVSVNRQRASDLGVQRRRRGDHPARGASPARWPTTSRTRRATTTTCACGCAPISAASPRTCCACRARRDKDDGARSDKILVRAQRDGDLRPAHRARRTISRKDLQREVRVSANTDGRALQEIIDRHRRAPAAKLDLPAGLRHRRRAAMPRS